MTNEITQPPTAEPLHETAARGVEAIHLIVAERDQLRKLTDTLEVNVAVLRQELESTRQLLSVCSVERDHYMRHSVELTAHLNDIQVVINEAIKRAAHAAYRPSTIPAPHPKLEVDPSLERLVAKLGRNGGKNVPK